MARRWEGNDKFRSTRQREMWYKILEYNFDSPGFAPLKQFADNYVQPSGLFLETTSVAAVALELKKFFFLAWLCFE